MVLVFQVLGFLVGGCILATVFAEGSKRLEFLLAGVGLVVALVASVLFWDHVWQIGSSLPESTRTASELSSFAAQHAADPSANNEFLAWARHEMLTVATHNRGTYYLEPATVLKEPELGQWSTYELLPERATSKLGEADWILFYGATASMTAERRRHFSPIMQFAPGYALARRLNAR